MAHKLARFSELRPGTDARENFSHFFDSFADDVVTALPYGMAPVQLVVDDYRHYRDAVFAATLPVPGEIPATVAETETGVLRRQTARQSDVPVAGAPAAAPSSAAHDAMKHDQVLNVPPVAVDPLDPRRK